MLHSPGETAEIKHLKDLLTSNEGLLALRGMLEEFRASKLRLELWRAELNHISDVDEALRLLRTALQSNLFLGPSLEDSTHNECHKLLRQTGFEQQIQTFDGLIKVTHGRILALLGELGHEVEGAVLDEVLQTFHEDSVFEGRIEFFHPQRS